MIKLIRINNRLSQRKRREQASRFSQARRNIPLRQVITGAIDICDQDEQLPGMLVALIADRYGIRIRLPLSEADPLHTRYRGREDTLLLDCIGSRSTRR